VTRPLSFTEGVTMVKINGLSAVTVARDGGKATYVLVKFGPIPVAKGMFGGKWNEQHVLNELRKQPKRFTVIGDGATILRSQGIAA
jgi:hypothetical protein